MPKNPRNYREEYDSYHKKGVQKKRRAIRNAGNNALKPGPGKEVDHKVPLSKGGSGAKSNLKVVSRTANRKKYNK